MKKQKTIKVLKKLKTSMELKKAKEPIRGFKMRKISTGNQQYTSQKPRYTCRMKNIMEEENKVLTEIQQKI
jgi:hypothetical protein